MWNILVVFVCVCVCVCVCVFMGVTLFFVCVGGRVHANYGGWVVYICVGVCVCMVCFVACACMHYIAWA